MKNEADRTAFTNSNSTKDANISGRHTTQFLTPVSTNILAECQGAAIQSWIQRYSFVVTQIAMKTLIHLIRIINNQTSPSGTRDTGLDNLLRPSETFAESKKT
ncbi:hypothetical protein BDV29DRAFT_172359 [Aspergillus leporis]|uniref:Uncharacterized protein n=1 Tax=Aspergillus leporis TaxID=41062 RepID=A0A5N5X502_9EURO|nr:hypothetical protein BDV29DRAFT_172359 [Aspergillus leporis]